MVLGDRRPSELFNIMKQAAGTTLSDSVLNDLWVSRLPPYVQAATIATNVAITEKIKIADSIIETIGMRDSQLHEVSAVSEVSNLKLEIAKQVRSVAAVSDLGKQSEAAKTHRLRIYDTSANMHFLIDTGADVSVIPKCANAARASPNGTKLFAANGSPISVFGEAILKLNLNLRREFLWNFLIADVSQAIIGADFLGHFELLVDLKKRCLLDRKTELRSICEIDSVCTSSIKTFNADICFSNIIEEYRDITRSLPLTATTKSTIEHRIITTGQPVYARPRRLSPEKLLAAKAEFDALLKLGICRPSSSNWASPLHMVRISEDDIGKTAITTPFGLFEFTHMTFGLRNAAQTFQRLINEVLYGLNFVFVYLDDVCIASASVEEHGNHLRQVLQRLRNNHLTFNVSKSEFGVSELQFLGHSINKDGIRPLPTRVEALRKFKQPIVVKELKRFLAMLNFYRRFLPNALEIQGPLFNMVRGNRRNDTTPLAWSAETINCFNACKEQLSNCTLLAHPLHDAELSLWVDASNFAAGAVLNQVQRLDKASDRQIHQLDFIAQITTDIRHVCGEDNVVADLLSRIQSLTVEPINYDDLAEDQSKDDELRSLLNANVGMHAVINGGIVIERRFLGASLLTD
ncbi:uncharacterized protein K02A2.6-like [Anastrepha ludens]|uniref:uncharacterized protein K02A2.6-like n=1 Tax=Anastrepha ludens TaxID=28586 RepID=UPI0023AEA38B|nr:uncharacterized protein K02A2.6-like [Anastrepha ludens]